MQSRELIVIKQKPLIKQDIGIVRIVAVSVNGEFQLPDPAEFATGGLWISKGYDYIDEKYDNYEPFAVTDWAEQDREDLLGSPDYQDHWAVGNNVKPIPPKDFIPVFRSTFPERGSGSLTRSISLPSGHFYFLDDDIICGPFTRVSASDEVVVKPPMPAPAGLQQHEVIKISLQDAENESVFIPAGNDSIAGIGQVAGFIIAYPKLIGLGEPITKREDYISDQDLVTYYTKHAFGKRKSPVGRKQGEILKSALLEAQNQGRLVDDGERFKRMQGLLDTLLSKKEDGMDIISEYLKTPDGVSFLNDYVSKNKKLIEDTPEMKQQLQELAGKKNQLETELRLIHEEVEKAKNNAKAELIRIREESEEQKKKAQVEQLEAVEKELNEKQNLIENLNEQVEELSKKHDNLATIDKIKEERAFQERLKVDLDNAIQGKQDALNDTRIASEVTKLDTLLSILHGKSYAEQTAVREFSPPPLATYQPSNGNDVINAVREHLDKDGRTFSTNEIANVMITMANSFLTIFKGLPGSGKTSTVVKLSEALHLKNEFSDESDSFLNISVSRGWVSSRDLLGFYNGLKSSYQESKTGLYSFLNRHDGNSSNHSLAMVLLDEANLSPIEHYWSDFLSYCDTEMRSKKIRAGHTDLTVSDRLRFIATINNDSTTEPLSPRLIDRAPIISMDIRDTSDNEAISASLSSIELDGAIKYSLLDNFFRFTDDYDNDSPILVKEFVKKMMDPSSEYGSRILVSHRKLRAINEYCAVAENYMDEVSYIDFALSQYAVPLISGHGSAFKERLSTLKNIAQRNDLTRTHRLLEDVIQAGDSYLGYYSFF